MTKSWTGVEPCWELIPEHMRAGLTRYIENGVMPGNFLRAVLSGDLFDALARADDINITRLPDYARFLYSYAPSPCWGSPARMRDWEKRGGLEGKS